MEKKTEIITFKLTPTLKKELECIAKKEDRTLSYVVNRILENYIRMEETV